MARKDFLASRPPAVPAPPKRRGMSLREKQRKLAAAILRALVATNLEDDKRDPIALHDLDHGLPDTVTNHIGTVIGEGQANKNGMHIWRDSKGHIERCRNNVDIATEFATDEDYDKILAERGWSDDDLADFASKLPTLYPDS